MTMQGQTSKNSLSFGSEKRLGLIDAIRQRVFDGSMTEQNRGDEGKGETCLPNLCFLPEASY